MTIVFPALAGRHDHRALALPERAEKVDHPVRVVRLPAVGRHPALENQMLARMHGRQPRETRAVAGLVRRPTVDELESGQRRSLAVLRTSADETPEFVARPESEAGDDLAADVDVVPTRCVSGFPAPYESRAAGEDLEYAQPLFVGHRVAIARMS